MKQIIPASYDDYRTAQVKANRKKRDNVWARREIIEDLAAILPGSGYGICHGIRNGQELRFFSEALPGWTWDGTDIAPVDNEFIQLDFHATLPCIYDCVYTNSLDHSPFPAYAVGVWLRQLKLTGTLFVEWSEGHFPGHTNSADVFGATFEEIEGILRLCGHLEDQRKYDGQRCVYVLRPFEGGRQ